MLNAEPEHKLSREQRSGLDRLRYDCRYNPLCRKSKTFAAVTAMGYRAGLFGRWYRKCPVKKPGDLYYAWQEGHRLGSVERERLKPEPPPRPGPNGGRRIRLAS